MARTGKIHRFEDLIAWEKSKSLSMSIYKVSSSESFAKDYALKNQIRRASISIMSNLAEGFERYSNREFRQYLSIARGSAAEVRSQLYLAHGLGYISREEFTELVDRCYEISKIIGGLRSSLII